MQTVQSPTTLYAQILANKNWTLSPLFDSHSINRNRNKQTTRRFLLLRKNKVIWGQPIARVIKFPLFLIRHYLIERWQFSTYPCTILWLWIWLLRGWGRCLKLTLQTHVPKIFHVDGVTSGPVKRAQTGTKEF